MPTPLPPLIGAHMSIQGGPAKAVGRAVAAGCACFQLFTRNNLRWSDKPLTALAAREFRRALRASGLPEPVAHAGYLANLASPDDALYEKSMVGLEDELTRCDQLGVREIVLHPGAHRGSGVEAGLRRVADALNRLLSNHRRVSVLLEITAGAGSVLGGTFEELAGIISLVRSRTRVGVCFDTCHAFAAGYDIRTRATYNATLAELDRVIGLDRLRAFHLNDAKGKLGERKDRHEHIGLGSLGDTPFRLILRDPRFADVPKFLETPKREPGGKDWDPINLERLRAL